MQRFETRDGCLKAGTIKRRTRNAMVHKGAAAYEVFTCLPEGADPARASFD